MLAAIYSCRATGSAPVSGTRIGVSSLRVSPRKKALNRTAQAIISGTPSASMPTPITKTPPTGPKAVKPFSRLAMSLRIGA